MPNTQAQSFMQTETERMEHGERRGKEFMNLFNNKKAERIKSLFSCWISKI